MPPTPPEIPGRYVQQLHAEKHVETMVLGWALHALPTETLLDFVERLPKFLNDALRRSVETAESVLDQSLMPSAIEKTRSLIHNVVVNRGE